MCQGLLREQALMKFFTLVDDKAHTVEAGIAVCAVIGIDRDQVNAFFVSLDRAGKLAFFTAVVHVNFTGRSAVITDNSLCFVFVGIPHATWHDRAASHHGQVGLDLDILSSC